MLAAIAGLLASSGANLSSAETPGVIYLIEIVQTNKVWLHFDTVPNKAYTVQYTDSLKRTTNGVTGSWTNLTVAPTAPAYPFSLHYVIETPRTNSQRFYRLVSTP